MVSLGVAAATPPQAAVVGGLRVGQVVDADTAKLLQQQGMQVLPAAAAGGA